MTDINRFDIATNVTDALIDVFDTMLSIPLELSDESREIEAGERIGGAVNLAGRVKGTVIIQVSQRFSRAMSAAMMGVDPEEVQDSADVKDVISEICNIVGGNLKSAFCDAGWTCELSPPAFTSGSDFDIEALGTGRYETYTFSHAQDTVVVKVGVRAVDPDASPEEGRQAFEQPPEPIALEKIEAFDIPTPLSESLCDTFDMMLSLPLTPSPQDVRQRLDRNRVVVAVSFVGPLMGSVSIHVSHAFARRMTAAMLGIDDGDVEDDEQVKDVVQELANIVGGALKSKFCDAGMPCDLSTPSFTWGSDFTIEARNMVRYERLSFTCGDDAVFVEVVARLADTGALAPDADADADAARPPDGGPAFDPQAKIDEMVKEAATGQSAEPDPETTVAAEADTGGAGAAEPPEAAATERLKNLGMLLDVPLDVSFELGRTARRIDDLLRLGAGSIVELAKLAGEPVDILVNNKLVARGEVVVENEKYGVRVTEIVSREERLKSLGGPEE